MTATRLTHRAVIRLAPQDPAESVAEFLQGLVTNDMQGSLPAYAALLSAQGKAMFDFLVWPGENGALLLDCEAEAADELVKRLSLYRLRRKIEIARDETLGLFWSPEGTLGAPDPRLTALGQRWIAPISGSEEPADAAWTAHRLALGVPEGRAELGDILWLETNAVELHGVSFDKGCYVGQENTARMNWRQKVNRRLVVVTAGSVEAKRIKAEHPDLGLAIAHMRIEDIPPSAVPAWMRLEAPDA